MLTGEGLACERGGRLVFRDLDFRLPAGGALVLVGPNGVGKSSLLRLMSGLALPRLGRIAWDGADVADDRERHAARLHYVGHLDAFKPALTVAENLAFWSRLRGGRPPVGEALRAFGLDLLADLPARYLSRGQQRRLALARLLTAKADLWLLDEPRAGLDRDAVDRLDEATSAHRAAGGMVAIALHEGARPPDAVVLDLAPFARLACC